MYFVRAFCKGLVAVLACITGLPVMIGAASAQIAVSGVNNSYPGAFTIGPGNTDIGNNGLYIGNPIQGNAGNGTLSVLGGSVLRVGLISVANSQTGTGSVTMSGIGSRLDLTGFSPGVLNRFEVGNWGTGSFVLSGGATIDGRANANACLGQNQFCHTFIGNAAGSNGVFTLTGAGTSASFLRGFFVGNVAVFGPPIDNFTFGTPGGTTQGRVEVLNGALLRTQNVSLTTAPGGSIPRGNERSFADVIIRGAGSTWLAEARTLDGQSALFTTGNGPNSWATVNISEGGKLRMEGAADMYNNINLTNGYGRTDFTVTGAGSRVEMVGGNSMLQVGTSLGTANMDVLAGAVVEGPLFVNVGRDGSRGTLNIDGAGSRLNLYGNGVAGTSDANSAPGMLIGRNGTGTVNVSNGGRIDVAGTGTLRGPFVNLGFQGGASGTVNISGANSVVSLTSGSAHGTGGPTESFNPFVSVGYDGSGTLNVSGGGKLLLNGGSFSTVAASRATQFIVGGRSDTVAGGNGVARISGAGSEVRVGGTDAIAIVGFGPSSTGQLTLSDNALLSSTIFTVGRSGGVGVAKVDNATVNLSGQFTGSSQSGAAMVIGDGSDSTGVVTLQNNARVTISNPGGTNGTGVSIGGGAVRSGGDGTLNMTSGSSLTVNGPAGVSGMTVGRTGTGLARVTGSTIDLGQGSLYVGRSAGANGVMIVTGGSSVSAGYVGIGRTQTGDGGTGTVVVNGSTLTANTIEIGANGYLGGNGTITGNIINYGIVNPGNSPGTLVVDGSFVNGLGGRLVMEIESNGQGGYNTDHLIFKNGTTVSLTGLDVQFRFLGATDPNAFKASGGFLINNFLQGQDAQGNLVNLAPETFAGTSFSARADSYTIQNFVFSPTAGATFAAAPVPEPEQWAMLLAGLAIIGAVARRRARARAAA